MKNFFKFDFSHFKGDTFGGLTASIVALPLALAFGVQSGMGAAAGLYGAFIIGVLAALFGGTPTQISGPTAPMTVISALLIAELLLVFNGDLTSALPTILIIFLLAGLLELSFGILGIGTYIKYIPYPVVSGFMTGIGVIILITQIFPLFGYVPIQDQQLIEQFKPQAEEVILNKILQEEVGEGSLRLENFKETVLRAQTIDEAEVLRESRILVKGETSGVLGSLKYFPHAIRNIKWLEFLLALLTIFIIYGFKRVTTKVPSTLVALLLVSIAAIVMGLEVRTIKDIGEIPLGFPSLQLSIFSEFEISSVLPYLTTALTLAMLGAIDSLLTSVVADNITKTKHDSNQELIGQGIGNSVVALFGGIPGAGATIRTVVNINSGGKTRLSGVIHGLFLLLILMVLGPLASNIPLAVLAGILITVGIGVMDYKGLRAIRKIPRTDAIVMIVVLVLTVFLDLIQAVGIGVVLAALMFMQKMGDVTSNSSRVVTLGQEENDKLWKDERNFPKKFKAAIYIKHLNGPLFFGYTNDFQQMMTQIPDSASHLILRMDKVPYIDQSGLFALDDTLIELVNKKDIVPLIVGIKEQPFYLLQRIDIVPNLVPEAHIFETFDDCVRWIEGHIQDRANPTSYVDGVG